MRQKTDLISSGVKVETDSIQEPYTTSSRLRLKTSTSSKRKRVNCGRFDPLARASSSYSVSKIGFETEPCSRITKLGIVILVVVSASRGTSFAESPQDRVERVAEMRGLVAFWDFKTTKDGMWTSWHDDAVVDSGYPVELRRIGDAKSYSPAEWPYQDEKSRLEYDSSGPFGKAVRFNQGYVFAEVARRHFDKTPLDIHGNRSFTLIAWTKFIGKRHMVAGIWDEGGWHKYGGRRQIALFGGLFGSKGVIGHISATGASSYPQSTASGSQYARCRAIDGRGFENDQWVALAMTFDPKTHLVTTYLDGVSTPHRVTDGVVKSVFKGEAAVESNPYHFPWPIYSPRSFVLKYNGYDVDSTGVYEHWLQVDTEQAAVTYNRSVRAGTEVANELRVHVDLLRASKSVLEQPVVFAAKPGQKVPLPVSGTIEVGDTVVTSLEEQRDGKWRTIIGKEIRYTLREGAPFTFGRALGLGNEPIDHGTQLFIDGVAVFNRVLSEKELRQLSFVVR